MKLTIVMGAWLAAYMKYPWKDDVRDTDGEGYWWSLDSSSLEHANYSVPWVLEDFIKWAEIHNIGWTKLSKITRHDFDVALRFIRDAAGTKEGASLSY